MSSLQLETMMARLLVDARLRADFMADPARFVAAHGLEGEERQAILTLDRTGLNLAARSAAAKRAPRR